MLRAAASAGRVASRGLRLASRTVHPAAAVAVQRLGLATLAPTKPAAIKKSSGAEFAAAAEETTAASVPKGKISQIIGAVVDVHFGTSFRSMLCERERDCDTRS